MVETRHDGSAGAGEERVALVPGQIASHTSCLLMKLGQVAYRLQEDRLDDLDLRVRHFSVLQGLSDEGPIGQLELARYLRIDPATMAVVLDQLEKRGAVSRERSQQDRRRYIVALTQAGKGLLKEANRSLDEIDVLLRTDLGDEQSQTLHEVLLGLSASPALIDAFGKAGQIRS